MRQFFRYCDELALQSPVTWVVGFSRTLLAIGLGITLALSDTQMLFDRELFMNFSLSSPLNDINLYFLLGYDNLWLGKLISLVILSCVISGYYPRFTGVLHWWVTFSFQYAASITEGGDQINAILTLLLVPLTVLDSRRNHWDKAINMSRYLAFWGWIFVFLIRFQMAVLYFHAGTDKLYKSVEWREGSALYYFLNDSLFGMPDWIAFFLNPLLSNGYFSAALTWGVIAFELFLSMCLVLSKRKRIRVFYFAVCFHLSIAVLFGLISFLFAMAGGLVLFLIPVDTKKPNGIRLKQVLAKLQFKKTFTI